MFSEYEDVCHDVPQQKCYTAHEEECVTVQVDFIHVFFFIANEILLSGRSGGQAKLHE